MVYSAPLFEVQNFQRVFAPYFSSVDYILIASRAGATTCDHFLTRSIHPEGLDQLAIRLDSARSRRIGSTVYQERQLTGPRTP